MVLRFGLERRFHLSGWGTVSSMSARHCYSGFCETALAGILRGRGIRQLIVTGCTTSVCVESTVRDAMFRNDPCCVLSDCTGEPIGRRDAQGSSRFGLHLGGAIWFRRKAVLRQTQTSFCESLTTAVGDRPAGRSDVSWCHSIPCRVVFRLDGIFRHRHVNPPRTAVCRRVRRSECVFSPPPQPHPQKTA